jgi:hypothetical protein
MLLIASIENVAVVRVQIIDGLSQRGIKSFMPGEHNAADLRPGGRLDATIAASRRTAFIKAPILSDHNLSLNQNYCKHGGPCPIQRPHERRAAGWHQIPAPQPGN